MILYLGMSTQYKYTSFENRKVNKKSLKYFVTI